VQRFFHAVERQVQESPKAKKQRPLWVLVTTFGICAGFYMCAAAQNAQRNAAPAPSTTSASLDASGIIPFLDQTLTWYRQMGVDEQIANDPSEVTIVSDNRALAQQIVKLSFDFARAEADAVASGQGSVQAQASKGASPEEQAIVRAENQNDEKIKNAESELTALKQKLATATGRQRSLLESQIAETQSELELDKARKDAIQNMLQFVVGASGEAGGLKGQIDALAASVPKIAAAESSPNNQNESKDQSNVNNEAAASEPAGIWGLGTRVFDISQKLTTINGAINETQALAKTSTGLRTPLIARLRQLSQKGDELASQPPDKDAATVAQQRQQTDELTAQFKQLTAIALPLSKQSILFGLYQRSLENWHSEVRGDLKTALASLGVRLAILGVFIGIVLILAEIAKRTIYRYVQEPHRRYQFLLLRKIGLAVAIFIIVAIGFASRLESAVTYAGLLTAGIAVALQNVIVAVVGYFFLIGRYGIRVGDRVQISGVTGEVVDIGLVRMQVMELGGANSETPTGRLVAISNSVVFQPGAGIFRQIPGTDFVWHEVSLMLAPDNDFKAVRERALHAAEHVLSDYHEEFERQSRAMQRNLLAVPQGALKPSVHLRLTPSGLEALVHFPVDARHAGEIDERVTRELLKAVDQEPKLKLAGSAPAISLRTAAGAA
jgi:small-conductance mechanosensitive channel